MNHGQNTDTHIPSHGGSIGDKMHCWAGCLWPFTRSITGAGVRQTLAFLQGQLPGLEVREVESGTRVMDWTVPLEWNIEDAWIEDDSGTKIVDFRNNNLHVVGYSEPVDRWLDLGELDGHLYSLPEQPDAIPYVTSYYERRWGFCLSDRDRQELEPGLYRAVIRSELKAGVLNYGELIIPGQQREEVFLSTYICHPSMANNELSGPVVTAALCQWLNSLKNRRYTYRIVFIPETIGSLVYLSRNLAELQINVVAGFNITCVGDERCYSYLPSRAGDTLADRAALHALRHIDPYFERYSWLDRGSDERQYCAPGVDLPIATIMRSKYGAYPEYHTSLDDLSLVTPVGLEGGFSAVKSAIEVIECNRTPLVKILGEPQLGRRGLYPTVSSKGSTQQVKVLMDLLTYADGQRDMIDIAELLNISVVQLVEYAEPLVKHGLIEFVR